MLQRVIVLASIIWALALPCALAIESKDVGAIPNGHVPVADLMVPPDIALVRWGDEEALHQVLRAHIGGCNVIEFGAAFHLGPKMKGLCSGFKVSAFRLYAVQMAFAMFRAQQASCGAADCATNKSSIALLLYPSPVPSARAMRDVRPDGSILMLIEFGLLSVVPQVVESTLLEEDRAKAQYAIPYGLSYSDWIGSWMKIGIGPSKNAPKGGLSAEADDRDLLMKDCGSEYTCSERYDFLLEHKKQFKMLSNRVYSFVLAHELAHLLDGEDCKTGSLDPEIVETACDMLAIERLYKVDGAELFDGTFLMLTHWMVAMHVYDRLISPTLKVPLENGKTTTVAAAFHGRNWLPRARALLAKLDELRKGPVALKSYYAKEKTDKFLDQMNSLIDEVSAKLP